MSDFVPETPVSPVEIAYQLPGLDVVGDAFVQSSANENKRLKIDPSVQFGISEAADHTSPDLFTPNDMEDGNEANDKPSQCQIDEEPHNSKCTVVSNSTFCEFNNVDPIAKLTEANVEPNLATTKLGSNGQSHSADPYVEPTNGKETSQSGSDQFRYGQSYDLFSGNINISELVAGLVSQVSQNKQQEEEKNDEDQEMADQMTDIDINAISTERLIEMHTASLDRINHLFADVQSST